MPNWVCWYLLCYLPGEILKFRVLSNYLKPFYTHLTVFPSKEKSGLRFIHYIFVTGSVWESSSCWKWQWRVNICLCILVFLVLMLVVITVLSRKIKCYALVLHTYLYFLKAVGVLKCSFTNLFKGISVVWTIANNVFPLWENYAVADVALSLTLK